MRKRKCNILYGDGGLLWAESVAPSTLDHCPLCAASSAIRDLEPSTRMQPFAAHRDKVLKGRVADVRYGRLPNVWRPHAGRYCDHIMWAALAILNE